MFAGSPHQMVLERSDGGSGASASVQGMFDVCDMSDAPSEADSPRNSIFQLPMPPGDSSDEDGDLQLPLEVPGCQPPQGPHQMVLERSDGGSGASTSVQGVFGVCDMSDEPCEADSPHDSILEEPIIDFQEFLEGYQNSMLVPTAYWRSPSQHIGGAWSEGALSKKGTKIAKQTIPTRRSPGCCCCSCCSCHGTREIVR